MPTLKANHKQILASKPIDGKKTRYRIEGVPGLWLYVSPSGVRTWYARYQIGSGQSRQERWFRIGDAKSIELAKAIERAKSIDAEVDVEDRDPHVERSMRRADTMTVVDRRPIRTHIGALQRQAFRHYAALRASSLGAASSQPRGWSTLRRRSWSIIRRRLTSMSASPKVTRPLNSTSNPRFAS
jgi:hypothetical protein